MSGRLLWVPLVIGVLPIAALQAGEGHDSHQATSHSHGEAGAHHEHAGKPNTEAHVHGEVMLQLALQGDDLVLELTSPAMNIVGFEHRASTPEQIKSVEVAEAKLRDLANWLKLDGGECRVAHVATDVSGLLPETNGAADNTHTDIDLDAQFKCTQPVKLRGLQLTLFRDFPGVEKVTLQWVSETGAGERVLSRNKSSLTFDP